MPNRLTGVMLFVLAVLLLSGSSAAYRHLSTGAAKYITHDHTLRRVLGRAERVNLRSGVMVKERDPMVEHPQQISEVSPSPQLVATYFRVFFPQNSRIDPNRLGPSLSPVLNL